jgi:hypothetical protein
MTHLVSDDAAENVGKINVRVGVKLLRPFPKYIAVAAGTVSRQEGDAERCVAG